jgi:hypothetical protein
MPTTEKPNAVATAVTIMTPRNDRPRSERPVTTGRIVNRVTAGTAVMIPIHEASIPIAFSHTGKNGR